MPTACRADDGHQPAGCNAYQRPWSDSSCRCASLSATGTLLVLFRVSHPPAGATYADLFARYHLSAERSGHHRVNSCSAYSTGSRHQSARWNTLSILELLPFRRSGHLAKDIRISIVAKTEKATPTRYSTLDFLPAVRHFEVKYVVL